MSVDRRCQSSPAAAAAVGSVPEPSPSSTASFDAVVCHVVENFGVAKSGSMPRKEKMKRSVSSLGAFEALLRDHEGIRDREVVERGSRLA